MDAIDRIDRASGIIPGQPWKEIARIKPPTATAGRLGLA
jgi:hypothetical protein